MKYIFYILVLIWVTCSANAQSQKQAGRISGRVIVAKTGEYLSGATVKIDNTTLLTKTDLDGHFVFTNVPPGTYSLTVSFVSYETKTVTDVVVTTSEAANVNFAMEPPLKTGLDEVVVTSRRSARQESMASLLVTQKNSAVVSDGIPAEIIRRTPDKNVGDVLKRISGASLQDDKFAIIRGLNDRYNASFLNGAPLPSTEGDRKATAFDIFPSNMIDNLVISKTASPDATGDFAGGIISITTKSIPTKGFTEISVSGGINTIATFKDNRTYTGSNTDWLGYDNGARQIPNGIPSLAEFPTTRDPRAELAKKFTNLWAINNGTAGPNFGFQISQGINVQRKGANFMGILLSATYSKSSNFSTGERNTFEYDRLATDPAVIHRNDLNDSIYSEESVLGLIANFNFKINNNNQISFKNLYSINGDDRVLKRGGYFDITGNPDEYNNGSSLIFSSNRIYTTQLGGDHLLGESGIKMSWLGSFSDVYRQIPDMRQLFYLTTPFSPDPAAPIQSGTASSSNAGTRFWSNTNETIYSGKIDFSKTFGKGKNVETIIKTGGFYQVRDRQFDARLLAFGRYNSENNPFNNSLTILPQESIFDLENMGKLPDNSGGFLLLDGTNSTDTYDAASKLGAGYLMADQRFGEKFRAIYGVRAENFNQKLNSVVNFTDSIKLNTTKLDFLPSVNLVYSLTPSQNLRFAYSRTVNRPEFRELAPFGFFNPVTRLFIYGSSDLKRASIQNIDLRYEIYPGRGQLLSASLFYKDFTDPIELLADNANGNVAFYKNALSANIVGVELEFRTLLSTLFSKSAGNGGILDKLTIAANAAFSKSEITLPGDFGTNPNAKDVQTRPLQGQSPYVFNGSAIYNDEVKGWGASFSANRIGQRIAVVGSLIIPDIWEQGRTVMDFQVNKTLMSKRLNLRLNIKDILAQKLVMFYDFNSDRKYNKNQDLIFSTNSFGQQISLSASFKF